MEWYYAEGVQQRGPVSAEEFERLVAAGAVKPDTLVWREGLANWQPYAQVAGPSAEQPVPEGGMVCSQCGKSFAPEEVFRYGSTWVCAECKPLVLQRLREGGPGLAAAAGGLSVEDLLARDYEVDVGGCLNQSWEMFKNNAGVILGATVLVYLVMFAINIIPYLSIILSLVLTGPLMGGLWLFYIRQARGEDATVGEAFSGFGPNFGQLVLANVVTGILSGLCLAPAMLLIVGGVLVSSASGQVGSSNETLGTLTFILMGILTLAGLVGYIYLTISWFFTLPLVADKGMSFWPAMSLGRRIVGKHFWWTLFLALVAMLLAMVGALFCLVGLLLTGPIAMGMLTFHYLRVFGDLRVGAE
jgi:hypothetical protein